MAALPRPAHFFSPVSSLSFLYLLKAHAALSPGATHWWQLYYADGIQPGHAYLLSGVYLRLEAENYTGPEMAQLQRSYLATWTRHLQQSRLAAQALEVLSQGEVEAVLLKGMAVSRLLNLSAHRTMDDFDLLIRPKDLDRAAEILGHHGWRSDGPLVPSERRGVTHGQSWHLQGQSLDLHWFIMPESMDPVLDEECRARARQVSLQGQVALALNPTDLLLHTLVHGCKGGSRQAWVCDGLGLLECDIDWQLLVQQARKRRVVLQCRAGLSFLVEELDASVPASALKALATSPVGLTDRLYYRVKSQRRRLWGLLLWPFLDYRRLPLSERQGGFTRYLTRRWNLQTGLWREALRRLRSFLAGQH